MVHREVEGVPASWAEGVPASLAGEAPLEAVGAAAALPEEAAQLVKVPMPHQSSGLGH